MQTKTTNLLSSTVYCMIIHKCIKIYDKKIIPFTFFSYQYQINMFFFTAFSRYIDWIFFLFSWTKTLIATLFFFQILWISLTLTGNFMSLNPISFAKSFSAIAIFLLLWAARCKYFFFNDQILLANWYSCYQVRDCVFKY